ncbi:MAG: tyrosine-protein phosphatase [Pseudomonadota bacterium]
MPFRPVTLPAAVPGSLWLSSMPGRTLDWPDFLAEAHARDLGLVVCLTPVDEMEELSPTYAKAVKQHEAPFEAAGSWMHLPARNFGTPADPQRFREGIESIAQRLQAGEAVLLHCAAGMGRTGTAAACVLKSLGLESAAALQRIRDAGSNPQNALQSGVIDWF